MSEPQTEQRETEQRDTAQPETHAQFCEREMLRLNNEKIEVKAHAERLAEAVKRLAIAVEALEGQEIEYRLAMELSNAAGNGRRELAAWEGAKK